MAFSRNAPAGLISKAFQRIVTNSTATVNTLSSTAQVGTVLVFSVETQSIRATFDGSPPTANTGVLFTAANSPYQFEGLNLANFKFVRATNGAIVNVQSFGRVGDK
jgi:hypothetical protein